MTITIKDITYDVVNNGDGTFALTPQLPPTVSTTEELIAEYRRVRDKAIALVDHRNQIVAKLQDLATRRDEIKTLLETAGESPDEDLLP